MNDVAPPPVELGLGNSEMHPAVLAYRLGQVEQGIGVISGKLDLIAQNYPTNKTIEMYLQPLRDDIDELKKEKREEEKAKLALTSQLKIAVVMAVLSPLFSIILTIIISERMK